MNITDWIQFWLALGTGVLAIISTISIIIVLFQNKQIIENSKRPFILIYKDLISNTTPIEYLVIKNSGSTTAHITSLEYDEESIKVLSQQYSMLHKALIDLNNSYIAPNQSYKIPFKSKHSNLEQIEFKITYTCGVKEYSDNFFINLKQDSYIATVKQHTTSTNPNKECELKDIAETLQELVKRIS